MKPRKFKPPRSRNPAADALARLKLRWKTDHIDEEWASDAELIVTPMLESVEGGIEHVFNALRAHDDEDAIAFLESYDMCSVADRKYLRLEDIAFAAGIGSLRLAEVAQTALFLYGQMQTKMLLAAGIPAIVQKSIKIAKTTRGLADREWMLKAGGVLPMPKGAQTIIQNVYAEQQDKLLTAPSAPAWKTPEERLREIQDMTEPRRLPSPPTEPITIGGHIDHLQEETIHILRDE